MKEICVSKWKGRLKKDNSELIDYYQAKIDSYHTETQWIREKDFPSFIKALNSIKGCQYSIYLSKRDLVVFPYAGIDDSLQKEEWWRWFLFLVRKISSNYPHCVSAKDFVVL